MDNIIGVYKFYLDKELIGEKTNAFTVSGRSIAIKSLLGIIPNFVNSIAYGIDDTANILNSASTLITNNSLGFEVGRSQTQSSTLRISENNDSLVYFAEINDPYQYEIREVGVYPSTQFSNSSNINGTTIINFDLVDNFIKNGTASASILETTSSARIGTSMFNLKSGDPTTNYIVIPIDQNALEFIDNYSSQDLFKLAMVNTSSTSSAASVYFRFFTDSTSYYTLPFIVSASGYSISNVTKDSAIVTGSPTWLNITSVRLWNSSLQDVKLDALKIDIGTYVADTNFGMISRATLPSPIFKPASIPLTIEYSLIVNFSGGI